MCASIARAQEPELPPVVEGPADAEVVLDGVESALDLLLAGDKAWKEGQRDAAFDAWRSAVVASAAPDSAFGGGTVVAPPPGPGADVDGTLARRAEDGAWSVRRRLALLGDADRAAWSARFEALGEIERQAAGNVPERLARVQREFPRTRAAARAALALCDLALERGDASAAGAWLGRARADAEEDLEPALRSRTGLLAGAGQQGDAPRGAGVPRLQLERVVELGPADEDAYAAIPGIALARGTTWFHGAGRLLRFDARGDATGAIDVLETLRNQGASASKGFSEPGAPWDDAIALGDGVLALVEGRAREDRGNALVGVEARDAARVAWIRDSQGLVRDGVRVDTTDLARVPALLEFQPGPLLVGDTLVVHVRAWPRSAEGATELDEAHVESWCAGLDPRDGSVRWARRLATGSTLRGMDRGRMSPPEPTALPALPPVAAEGRVALDTGLGAIALLDAVDGRVAAIVRTSRRAARSGAAGGIAAAGGAGPVGFAPAAGEGALLRLRPGPDVDGKGLFAASPLVLSGPRIPVSAGATDWQSLAPGSRGIALVSADLASGREMRSAEFPFAAFERASIAAAPSGTDWIVTAGGRAYALDRGLRLCAEVEIGPRSAHARNAIAVGLRSSADPAAGRAIRIAGPNRIAFLTSD